MPTSPRDLAGGTGWYQPTALLSNPRADEGHQPLRERQDCAMQPGPDEYFRAPLHTRPCGATLSKQERAGVSLIRQGLRPATFPGGEGCLRREITVYLLCCLLAISPGDSSTGCYTAVERGCEEGGYPQKYSTALLQAVEKFSRFPRRVRRQGRGERRLIRVI